MPSVAAKRPVPTPISRPTPLGGNIARTARSSASYAGWLRSNHASYSLAYRSKASIPSIQSPHRSSWESGKSVLHFPDEVALETNLRPTHPASLSVLDRLSGRQHWFGSEKDRLVPHISHADHA